MELFTLICEIVKLIANFEKVAAFIERCVGYIKMIAKKK